MPVNLTIRYPDTDTELLQQILNMLGSPDPQSYIMPDYIGTPPFLDTKTQLLYELFLQLQSGGGGGPLQAWRYYEVLDLKAPGDDFEAWCDDSPLDLLALPEFSAGLIATGIRINLQISVGPSNAEPWATVLTCAGNILQTEENGPYIYRSAYGLTRYYEGTLYIEADCLAVQNPGFPNVMLAPGYRGAVYNYYLTDVGLNLNTERVRFRWGVEIQPRLGISSPAA